MIKLVFSLRRKPELSREGFQEYWLGTHGPLVRSHAEVLGIRRYVQVHALHENVQLTVQASRGAPPAYDGVAELWYDSLEAIGAAVSTDEGRAAALALLEDERRFIDHANSPLWFGEEHQLIAP
jgi:uncharacterized protein (TIGR02118 family)